MKQLYTMSEEKHSIHEIARTLGISRNTVRKYLRSPELPKPALRQRSVSGLIVKSRAMRGLTKLH